MFNSLSIVSFNVRGIRENVKRKALFLFCKRSEADIVMLQETHSTETEAKFWKSQWGNTIHYSHGSSHSAGVAILLHKFKGEVLELIRSSEGRWILMVVKQGNATYVLGNIYGYNSSQSNKILFGQISSNVKHLNGKYKDSYVILGGDFNECIDTSVDRFPSKLDPRSITNNLILSLGSDLSLIDAWRFFNPESIDFTWSNNNLTLKSRIDMFLISQSALHFVQDVLHSVAPLSDHKLITLKLGNQQNTPTLRGYWKINNALLNDVEFNDSIKELVKNIFSGCTEGYKEKWEFFKYKTRRIAIKRCKMIKANRNQSETDLLQKLDLLTKENNTEEEKLDITKISLKLDELYTDLAKGAFVRSRAKWLEVGEKNSNYFFALEKRNGQRKTFSSLNINGTICTDYNLISEHITKFYEKLYSSKFDQNASIHYIEKIKEHILIIDTFYKETCDSKISTSDLKDALHSMKKGKSPGIDGLSVEFYSHFWEYLEGPLFCMFNECIRQKEMTSTMKQGVISLIPKPGKDILLIDNWRPISLLTIDYKILALVYARRLKIGLDKIVSETQSGFIKNRHITNNIRLVLDLLDYGDTVQSEALILFLDFYKAFDTIEHTFLFQSLKLFGFGLPFINIVEMLYKDINSSIIVNHNTTQRFSIERGIRQGCPISPFLFLLVTELLALGIKHDLDLKGLTIFDKEIKISQLADDTILFLHDKNQLARGLNIIEQFSNASGLRLNVAKCELLPLKKCSDTNINNIPVKHTVKYLGIQITKDYKNRQQLNFTEKIVKTKSILNSWLQRDLSIFGRILLSKADGISHFVYPSLSLFINDKTIKQINKIFLDFIWKNKPHKLKKEVLTGCRANGGLDFLDFTDTINTFRISWIKRCISMCNSLWFFIPNHIFNQIGGLSFVLKCQIAPNRLPVVLSNFHQQCLLAWKLCFIHNFSPHKMIIWNNELITINKKSIFYPRWFEKGIHNIISLFDCSGSILTYDQFLSRYCFPVPFKEFNLLIKAIPKELTQTFKCHLSYGLPTSSPTQLLLNGINILDKKCDNKHIRHIFELKHRISPRGKFYWASLLNDIQWREAWLLPYKYCITNKVKEVHFKILHKIYPTNTSIAKYVDLNPKCSFCESVDETLLHLFVECGKTKLFLYGLNHFLFEKLKNPYSLTAKDIIIGYENSDKSFEYMVNFFILQAKFFIHKQKWQKKLPCFKSFKLEIDSLLQSLRNVRNNKKNDRLLYLISNIMTD